MAYKESLPSYKNSDGIKKTYQDKFGGYNHTLACGDGGIYDEWNMSSDHYPVMSPRYPRMYWGDSTNNTRYSLTTPLAIDGTNGLVYIDGNSGVYYNGTQVEALSGVTQEQQIVWLNDLCCVFPMKRIYNFGTIPTTLASMESSVEDNCIIQDGTIYGQPATLNTLVSASTVWLNYFKVGDAVRIYVEGAMDKTAIIREINGNELRFSDNAFDSYITGYFTISRTVPDMDFIFENDNRLWGCRGDTIYASKLGDPYNWNVFDGIASDSYAVDVGGGGSFTAACSYQGYPTFFKDNHIYKVYGTKPSNFQVSDTAASGVEFGSYKSLAIANDTLYYKSSHGIMAYRGGYPQNISHDLGIDVWGYYFVVAGSDGDKYYCNVKHTDGTNVTTTMFVYDTRYNIWHKEDDANAFAYTKYYSVLYCLTTSGEIFVANYKGEKFLGYPGYLPLIDEGAVNSWAEFGDFVSEDPNKKGVSKVQFRVDVPDGASMAWAISYDKGEWLGINDSSTHSTAVPACSKRSFYRAVPIAPTRTDNYRLKVTGTGYWKVYSLSRDEYSGSELQKH